MNSQGQKFIEDINAPMFAGELDTIYGNFPLIPLYLYSLSSLYLSLSSLSFLSLLSLYIMLFITCTPGGGGGYPVPMAMPQHLLQQPLPYGGGQILPSVSQPGITTNPASLVNMGNMPTAASMNMMLVHGGLSAHPGATPTTNMYPHMVIPQVGQNQGWSVSVTSVTYNMLRLMKFSVTSATYNMLWPL